MILEASWRTGRKVGRTIYAMAGKEPSDQDILIGMMDTPEIATATVDSHNTAAGEAYKYKMLYEETLQQLESLQALVEKNETASLAD